MTEEKLAQSGFPKVAYRGNPLEVPRFAEAIVT